jgi:Na+-translocating membrane potential-generating system (MpsB)
MRHRAGGTEVSTPSPRTGPDDAIERALSTARHVLPDQGPIGVFIHHNTLHAFQHLPFHRGVQAGADALGARPYLSLREFRAALRSGRIADIEVRDVIERALGARARNEILPGLTMADFWHQLMVSEFDTDDAAGLTFTLRAGPSVETWRCGTHVSPASRRGRIRPPAIRAQSAVTGTLWLPSGCRIPIPLCTAS